MDNFRGAASLDFEGLATVVTVVAVAAVLGVIWVLSSVDDALLSSTCGFGTTGKRGAPSTTWDVSFIYRSEGQTYGTIVINQLFVRASAMQNLQLPHQLRCFAPKSLWDLRRRGWWELLVDLILSQCVVHERLDCLLGIHFTGKDIVQPKLSWK